MSKSVEKKVYAVTVNIREQRLVRNYTQDYLACKLGISQNAYSKIELGITPVTVKRLFVIAETLDVDVNVLIGNWKE